MFSEFSLDMLTTVVQYVQYITSYCDNIILPLILLQLWNLLSSPLKVNLFPLFFIEFKEGSAHIQAPDSLIVPWNTKQLFNATGIG